MKQYSLLVILSFAFRFATAQSAADIIEKYIETRGGLVKLESIKSIIFKGDQEYYGKMEQVTITFEQGKLHRFDIKYDGQNGYWMLSRNSGGQYFPWEKKPAVIFPDSIFADKRIDSFDIPGRLVHYKDSGWNTTLVKVDTINNELFYKIQINNQKGNLAFYWISCKSYLLAKIERLHTAQNDKGKVVVVKEVTTLEDYRSVEGILFDYRETIQTFYDAQLYGTKRLYFDEIELNKPIPSELYQLKPF